MSRANTCKYCGRYIAPGTKRCEHCGGKVAGHGVLWTVLLFMLIIAASTAVVVYFIYFRSTPDIENPVITKQFSARVNEYQELTPYNEGVAAVSRDGKWGYIDAKGNCVIACVYDHAAPFNGGVAQVKVGRRIAYINKEGKEVSGGFRKQGTVRDVNYRVFTEGGERGKCGIADIRGNIVVPAMFDSLTYISEGLAVAVLYSQKVRGVDMGAETDSTLPEINGDNIDRPISFLSDSALHSMTYRTAYYGYVDLHGNYTIPENVIEEAEQSNRDYKLFVARQKALANIENQRKEVLAKRQLADSIEAVLSEIPM